MQIIRNPWAFVALTIVVLLFLFLFKSIFFKAYNYIVTLFKGIGSHLTDEQANFKAVQLLDALDGWLSTGLGSDTSLIIEQLKNTSKADYYKISRAFGVKDFGLGGEFFLGESLNLSEWFAEKLSDSQIEKIQKEVPYFKNVIGA